MCIRDSEVEEEFKRDARAIVDEATDIVESAPYPETSDFHKHVYA